MQTVQTTLLPNNLLLIHDVVDVQRVLAHVSPAKLVRHPQTGAEMVAARYSQQVVERLQELGIYAPSPVLAATHKWTGRHPPMSHQKETVDFLLRHRACLVLSDMGTGKTASALWAADYLMRTNKVRRALIFAPLSCLNRVWMDELFTWVPHRTGEILHAARDRRKYLARRSAADFLILNHDGLGVVQQELAERGDIDLIIYDEASALRNARTDRYRTFRALQQRLNCRLWLLTGTPTPQAPTDAWALARLVNPQNTPTSFTRFRESTMWKASQFKWRPRNNADLIVRQTLKPAIRHRKEDCIDLPPVTYTQRETLLTREQATAFLQMKKLMQAEAQAERAGDPNHQITAVNAATRLLKLLQICSGSVYTDDGKVADLPMQPRIEVLLELIQQSEGKTIVYVPFRHTLARLEKALQAEGLNPAIVHGGITGSARDAVIQKFQHTVDTNPLLAQPRTASHGLNLTVASTIVWFGPVFSAEQYQQANERMARPGQTMKMTIAHLGAHPIEWAGYEVVKDKTAVQSALLSLYESVIKDQHK